MKKALLSTAICITLGTVLLGSSCSKKAQELPKPTEQTPPGPSITGIIQPADAVLGVSVIDTVTRQSIIHTSLNSQGAYSFSIVPAGTYVLSFDKQLGYVPPRQRRVAVAIGKTTVVPTITVVKSTGSVLVDGVALPAPMLDLGLGGRGFSILFSDASSCGGNGTYRLQLSLPAAVKVGTYSLEKPWTYAVFEELTTAVFDSRLNPATIPVQGTFTITAVENTPPYPRFVSGTFRFTGTDAKSGTQKTVSGTFENAYF